MPDISVVIPAYNEARRLPPTLDSVHQYLFDNYDSFEIIVVNDGSVDGTVAVVEEFARHHDGIRLLSHSPNQGKGHAVRQGMLAALGDVVLFNDADGSSPIAEVARLHQAIKNGADIAIGSRNKPDPGTKVQALAHRKYIGNTFNLIVQSLLLPGIFDTQCGFKLFKRAVAQDIFSLALLDGFAFDVEILFIGRGHEYKIEELAINWSNVEGSKVNVIVDSIKMFLDVLGIRVRSYFGVYSRREPASN
jgi:dolichyl-phosphate beta-glucosyltransferase